jgi:hypothetical protein
MESPEGWDLLTSSLAVCDLQKPAAVWAFLAVQGLVRDQPSDRIAFFKIVHKVRTKSPSTSSSRARRVAQRLRLKGMALPAGDMPDPNGEIALGRRQLMEMWTKSFIPAESKSASGNFVIPVSEFVQEMRTLCNACFTVYKLGDIHQCPESQEAKPASRQAINVVCDICDAVNRMDARFCRGCGSHFPALEFFNFGTPKPASSTEQGHIEVIWESGNYDSPTAQPAQETERCFLEVMNIIRDLKATKGLSKKSHKR